MLNTCLCCVDVSDSMYYILKHSTSTFASPARSFSCDPLILSTIKSGAIESFSHPITRSRLFMCDTWQRTRNPRPSSALFPVPDRNHLPFHHEDSRCYHADAKVSLLRVGVIGQMTPSQSVTSNTRTSLVTRVQPFS